MIPDLLSAFQDLAQPDRRQKLLGEGYVRIALVQSEARLAEFVDRAEKWLAK